MDGGETVSAVALRHHDSRPTVTFWRMRCRERGPAGLHNELKSGRPRTLEDEQIATLINTALQKKSEGQTHLSRRSLAEHTGLSKSTVQRY